jgi:hypothetical protein
MTEYILPNEQCDYINGVIHTLQFLDKCDTKTLWKFCLEYCSDPQANFLYGVEQLRELGHIESYFKFDDEEEPIEVNEDEADYVDIN